MSTKPARRGVATLIELEPRILYSADPFTAALGLQPLQAEVRLLEPVSPSIQTSTPVARVAPVELRADERSAELVFIDSGVSDWQLLADDIEAQRAGGRPIEVIVLDATRDGVTQIGEALAGRSGIGAIHIVSHGSDAQLRLGSATLSAETLDRYAARIAEWRNALDEGADLLLYGCDVAADDLGRAFAGRLASLTGADVAASADLTGASELGGNWLLEYSTGRIEAALAASAAGQLAWQGTLDSGTAIYRSATSTTPLANRYDGSAFSAASSSPTSVGGWKLIATAEAPTRDEVIAIGIDDPGVIRGQIWNGSSWSALPINPLGTVTNSFYHSFDVAYEANSGRAVLVWDDAGKLKSSVWDGSSWSAPTIVAAYSGGDPQWLRLAAKSGSNEMVLAIGDFAGSRADHAMVWDGGSWGNMVTLSTSSSSVTDVQVAYEQVSGVAMAVYTKTGIADGFYRRWDGAAWSAEGTIAAPAGAGTNPRWTSMAADPTSNRLAIGVTATSNQATWFSVWNGSAWMAANTVLATTNANDVSLGSAVAFEHDSGRLLAAYAESTGTTVRYRTWTAATGWSAQQNGPSTSAVANSLLLSAAPTGNEILLGVQDNSSQLRYVRWSGSAWDATPKLVVADTTQQKNQPFAYVWDRSSAAPVMTLPSTALVYTENDPATVIDAGATVTDSDSPDFNGGTLTVDFSANGGADDRLSVRHQGNAVGQIGVAGSVVSYGGLAIGSVSGGVGAVPLTVTFSGAAATPTAVQALARCIAYANVSENPSTLPRTVRFVVSDGDGGTSTGVTQTVNVIAVNDAPTLSDGAVVTLAGTNEDTISAATAVDTLFAGASASDVDGPLRGIAITSKVGNGSWQYSTDGTGWTAFGAVAPGNALLLASGSLVRYAPDAANGETASFAFKAWDRSSGTASTNATPAYANAGAGGGSSAYSAQAASAVLTVSTVNDAPVLAGSNNLNSINRNPAANPGTLVADLIAGQVSDVDAGAQRGIAVTTVNNTTGSWEYSTNSGSSWTAFGAPTAGTARLLAADIATFVRFVPVSNWSGTVTGGLGFKAWDRSSGAAGDPADASVGGGSTAFSAASASASIVVTASNTAPTLSGANDLASINEDAVGNSGTLVSALIAGMVSDPDPGAAAGIAVTAVDNTRGSWQYTLDGSSWTAFGSPSATQARLLHADATTAVRFVPAADFNGNVPAGISFRAWDRSSGTAGGTADTSGTTGTYVDQFSTASYSNSHGTLGWASDWVETDSQGGGATAGRFRISGGVLDMQLASTNDNIYREANLSGALSAMLSFSYSSGLGSAAQLHVQASRDGGASYTTLAGGIFSASANTGAGSVSYDITSYVAANTRIRLFVASGATGAGVNALSIDNMQIATTARTGGATAFSTAVASSNLTVLAVNDAPVRTGAAPAPIAIDEDGANSTALSLGLGMLAYGPGGGSDEAAQALAYKVTAIPAAISLWLADGSTPVASASALTLTQLQGLKFKTLPDANGSGLLTWTVQDNGGTAYGGVDTLTEALAITVNAVNDAPTATNLSAAQSYTEDTPLALTPIVVSDVDSANMSVTLTLSIAGAGSLNTGSSGTVTSTYNAATGVWSASGAIADVNALLAALVYTPTLDYNASFSIATNISDGTAPPVTGSKAMTGIAVNDAPVVATSNSTRAYPIGSGALAIDTGLTLSDVDSSNLTGASVAISAGYASGKDVLAFVNQAGITGAWDAVQGTLKLSGTATVGQYQAALRSVTFQSGAVASGAKLIAFQATDGSALSEVATRTITVGQEVPSLWVSSKTSATTSPGTGSFSYNDGQVARISGPNLRLGMATSNATFTRVFDIDSFAGDGNADIDGLHYVSMPVTVGTTNAVTLQRGDILFTTTGSETFAGLAVTKQDVILFRPNTPGDYTAGTFSLMLRNPAGVGASIREFALVETAMTVGGTSLKSGDFLVTFSSSSYDKDVSLFRPTVMGGVSTAGSLSVLIDGDTSPGIGIVTQIHGLELVQSDTSLGGVALRQGQLLISLSNNASVGTNALAVTAYDIFTLTVTATGQGTSSATAAMLLRGNDVELNSSGEEHDAIALVGVYNTAPVLDVSKSPAMAAIDEDAGAPVGAVGMLVSALVDFSIPAGQVDNVVDPDTDAERGIAVIAADAANGSWWYSLDNGSTWATLGSPSNTTARLLAADAGTRLYFQPVANYNGTMADAIVFRAWDRVVGSNGGTANTATNGGATPFSVDFDSASLTVNAINDAPTISQGAVVTLPATNEDAASAAATVDALLASAGWSDVDAGALKGVAITGAVGNGTWQYSTDGVSWSGFGAVSASNALLLASGSQVRYAPDQANGETATFAFKAWDRTSGTASTNATPGYANPGAGGGTRAYSSQNASTTLTVTSVNDAPTITNGAVVTLTATNEDTTSSATTVDTLLASTSWADVDTGALKGIAITAKVGNGTWEYSTDGVSWSGFGAVSSTNALLLASGSQVRYAPDQANGETATFAFKAWDRTNGTASTNATPGYANPGAGSGTSAYSSQNASTTLTVTSVNDAPTITNGAVVTLTATNEDTTSSATTIDALLASAGWADVDMGALNGIAVTAKAGNGTWQYSTDGVSWTGFGAVSASNALLLASGSQVRYQPDLANGETATFAFRAWDRTSGTASTNAAPAYANPGTGGAASAYSSQSASTTLTVNPVNDAPTLADAKLAPVYQGTTSPAGQLIGDLFDGGFADVDAGASLAGVAVVGNTASAAQGVWQYSSNGGANWRAIGTVDDSSGALALSRATLLRFTPAVGFAGMPADLVVRALDYSYAGSWSATGASETRVLVATTVRGGSTAIAAASSRLLTSVETAPTVAPVLSGANPMTAIDEDAFGNSGTLVSALIAGRVTSTAPQLGIAVTAVDNSQGAWQYTRDGGSSWSAFGAPSESAARLLAADSLSRVRFVPNADWNGTLAGGITFHAWDQSSYSAGGTARVTPGASNLTVRDDFSTVSYSNNDGPQSWAGPWVETEATGGGSPTNGSVRVKGGEAYLGTLGTETSLTRPLDLRGTSSVRLDLSYAPGSSTAGSFAVQFSTDGGASFTTAAGGVISGVRATVALDVSAFAGSQVLLRLQSLGGGSGTQAEYRIDYVQVSATTPFSTAAASASIEVRAVNDAPTIANGTVVNLVPTDEDTISSATTVASLLAGASASDVDAGALRGIAITGKAGNGNWQYSTDGFGWTSLGTVSATNALLLAEGTQLRYQPDAANGEAATFAFKAWDQSGGVASTHAAPAYANPGTGGGTSAYSSQNASASLAVSAVNDAPTLASGAVIALAPTNEDTDSAATSIDALLASAAWADVDAGALKGVAITGAVGNGTWQYSTDGVSWSGFGAVSSTNALLLASGSQVRYAPDQANGETATFAFKAWDRSSGTASTNATPGYANPGAGGGTGAWSSQTASSTLTVTSVNDAPTLGDAKLAPVAPGTANPPGQTAAALFDAKFGDVDTAGSLAGVAVVGNTAAVAQGVWQYSSGGGAGWRAIGTVDDVNAALVLGRNSLIRFVPAGTYTGNPPDLVLRALDNTYTGAQSTSGATEVRVLLSTALRGGATALAAETSRLSTAVESSTAAPVLNGSNAFSPIDEDALGNAGTLVSVLIAGRVTSNAPQLGIAVTGTDTSNGRWQYSRDGGGNWSDFGAPSEASARLLSADTLTRVRFVSDADWNGTVANGITFRAWDQTTGVAGGTADTLGRNSTFLDRFLTASYANNDGDGVWTSAWTETDPGAGGATGGKIFIAAPLLRFGESVAGSNLVRQADLSGAGSATLAVVLAKNDLGGGGSIGIQVSRDGGATFTTLQNITSATSTGTLSFNISAHIAANTQVRFYDNNGGGKSIAIDEVRIVLGGHSGGGTAYSVAQASASVEVRAVNDAPTLTNGAVVTLVATNEDTTSAATTVETLLAGASWADVDAGALKGIAITGKVGNGTWQYSTDGVSWSGFGAVSASNALLLASGSQVRYQPDLANGETATFAFKAWDRSSGTASTSATPGYANPGAGGGIGAYSSQNASAMLTVTSVNDAPTMAGGAVVTLAATNEDTTSTPTTVDALLTGAGWADVDTGALKGIAVTAKAGNGTWQYSTDGVRWSGFGAVSSTNALLLASGSQVRYAPDQANGETATFAFKAWDRTSGIASTNATPGYASSGVGGGISAYSSQNASTTLTVTSVNDAPTIANGAVVTLTATNEDTTSSATTVDTLLASASWADVDTGALKGIAITATAGNGSWQYSTDGVSWSGFGAVSAGNALLLASGSQVRYQPNLANGETATFAFKAWDRTSGIASTNATPGYASSGVGGGISAYSSQNASTTLTVISVNDAPTITTGAVVTLTATNEDTTSSANTVDALLASAAWADVDTGAMKGIAITAKVGNGTWQYSTDGVSWSGFGAVSSTNALLLASGSQVRYAPDQANGETATFAFKAWDRGSGTASTNVTPGYANAGAGGGTSAYSSHTASALLTVTPVNDAPTLMSGTSHTLAPTDEDTPSLAVRVATLLSSAGWRDVDAGALGGIAITAATGLGSWQFSDGVSWQSFAAPSPDRTLLLDAATELRYLPDARNGESVRLSFVAWDRSSGTASSGAPSYGDARIGGGDAAYSTATATVLLEVAAVNDAPTGVLRIAGDAVEDAVLHADVSEIADADGLGAFAYQWLRDGHAVAGATASSYRLDDADVGARMSVVVSYTDGWGTAESLTSTKTARIANVNDAPVGRPVVVGTATENQTLTVDAFGISDADGLGAFSYQWLRDGASIAGATTDAYALANADVNRAISVRLSYVDAHGTAEQLTSAATSPIVNVNDAPTGRVVVIGNAVENATLRADTTIADADGLGAFSYQWLRDGAAIAGATTDAYTLGNADVDRTVSVRVSYVDAHGTAEQLTSTATAPIVNVNDAPTGQVVVIGNAVENARLRADTTAIADADGLGAFSYQWLRDGAAIAGATTDAYTLGNADVDRAVSVRVSYVDAHGTAEQLMSAATAPIVNVNDAPTGQVVVIGNAVENATLRADTTTIAEADGLGAFSYQWLRDGAAIAGATTDAYTLGNADVARTVSVRVSYVDAHGTAEQLTSAATSPIVNVNDAPTGRVVVIGNAVENATLRADTTTIADADGLGAFSYQWLRDGAAIAGATTDAYTLGNADVARAVSVRVSYVDAHGTAEQLTSAATSPIVNVNDAPTGQVAIVGDAVENATLRADTSIVADADGLGAFSYQWLRDGAAIAGATTDAYTLGNADVARAVSVRVSYVDAHGTAEQLTSAATSPIANVNDAPTGRPIIIGTVGENRVLRADPAAVADADGLGAFNYQWFRDGAPIAGATAATYQLGSADVGRSVAVALGYTDGHGAVERLVSASTAPVPAAPGSASVVGQPVENQTLRAELAGVAPGTPIEDVSYQWLRDGKPIAGATGDSYTVRPSDIGRSITVRVSYSGDGVDVVRSASAPATVAPQSVVVVGGTLALRDAEAIVLSPKQLATLVAADARQTADVAETRTLTYAVSDVSNGRFELVGTPGVAVSSFSYADLSAGRVRFIHSVGSGAPSFEVQVSDNYGNALSVRTRIEFTPAAGGGLIFYAGASTTGAAGNATASTPTPATGTEESQVVVRGAGMAQRQSTRTDDFAAAPADGYAPLARGAARGLFVPERSGHIDLGEQVQLGDFSYQLATFTFDSAGLGRPHGVNINGVPGDFGGPRDEAQGFLSAEAARLAGISLSAGAVWWALRVGGLFASLLASIPTWRQLDLLPVLRDASEDDTDWHKDDEDDDDDDDARREEQALDRILGDVSPGGR